LGTSFDVRHYPDDRIVRVAVTGGKVETQSQSAKTTIVAGSVAQVTDSTGQTAVARDARASTDWVNGRLIFNEAPASEMLTTVGRWYGYTFTFADSTLADRRVIAVFRISDASETLKAIQQLLNVTMTFDGSTVILRQRRPNPSSSVPQRGRSGFPSTHIEAGK
jgi:transmembrane sensor